MHLEVFLVETPNNKIIFLNFIPLDTKIIVYFLKNFFPHKPLNQKPNVKNFLSNLYVIRASLRTKIVFYKNYDSLRRYSCDSIQLAMAATNCTRIYNCTDLHKDCFFLNFRKKNAPTSNLSNWNNKQYSNIYLCQKQDTILMKYRKPQYMPSIYISKQS